MSSMDLDDDGWEDMPIIRSEPNALGLDEEDEAKYHYKPPARLDPAATVVTGNAAGTSLGLDDTPEGQSWRGKLDADESDYTRLRLEEDADADEVHMRTRYLFDEDKAMTPLSQMQATKNLLTEGQRIAYVGLCKLACEEMVEELRLVAQADGKGGKKKATKGVKEDIPTESSTVWGLKIMARLYHHMELEREEQKMIESLAAHGVIASDLVPALMTTHTVPNPEYDPAEARRQKAEEEERKKREAKERVEAEVAIADDATEGELSDTETEHGVEEKSLPKEKEALAAISPPVLEKSPPDDAREDKAWAMRSRGMSLSSARSSDRDEGDLAFGMEDEEEEDAAVPPPRYSRKESFPPQDAFDGDIGALGDDDDDPFGGDIGASSSPSKPPPSASSSSYRPPSMERSLSETSNGSTASHSSHLSSRSQTAPSLVVIPPPASSTSPTLPSSPLPHSLPLGNGSNSSLGEPSSSPNIVGTTTTLDGPVEENVTPVLPGVSTTLSAADKEITLDIRWTVLCDLFLALIADSVYDSRSRVLLERVASKLNLGLLDVVRFEKRVTDSLEIQEGVEKMESTDVIDNRRTQSKNKRYMAIGLATLGGGLVIGLSAGLLAPVIGAALGGALTTIGVTGTTGFLAGAGGAAAITTGGVLTGSTIATKGMVRRTQYVRTFELRSLHNQKRVNCFITMPGFMSSKDDDVRLPFSTLDPMVGDVYTALWEPEMMEEMGNALKILTTEVLTNLGQTVLQATVLTAVMSALQWPLILTKLGYLIDNPWSNALDRAKAAGLVLADTLINRHVGVRPVSLIGFSLGSRVIFYALVELAHRKAFGIVQDVYLFGGTITANKKAWLDVRGVVAGRFVNGYARNDWVLGYLFRATAAGNTVAGLRPVEGIPGLENVDVTAQIAGHMSYRPMMPLLLHSVGLPVTADYFDEPEEPDFVDDRVVITDAELEAQKEAKKRRWISRRKKPTASSSTLYTSSSSNSRPPSFDVPRSSTSSAGNGAPEYDDDDDLPPREEDVAPSPTKTPKTAAIPIATEPESTLAPTAGFDFSAISQALGKDIDVAALKAPGPELPRSPAEAVREVEEAPQEPAPPIIKRSESTPPSLVDSSREDAFAQARTTDRDTLPPLPSSPWANPSPPSFSRPLPSPPSSPRTPTFFSPSSLAQETSAWASSSTPSLSFPKAAPAAHAFPAHLLHSIAPPPEEPAMSFASAEGDISGFSNQSPSKRDGVVRQKVAEIEEKHGWGGSGSRSGSVVSIGSSEGISERPRKTISVLDNPWG